MKVSRTNQIPVFPNTFPYNELLMTCLLLAKTREWRFSYRGPILLYTSGRDESSVCWAYNLNPKDYPHSMVVGRAILADVRPLVKEEKETLVRQFNPKASEKIISDYLEYGIAALGLIRPGFYGYFFEKVERLPQPVKIHWPRGAVTVCYLPLSEAAPIMAK